MSATKIYCLISSGKVPPCMEKTEDLKSTSELKLTEINLLSFLSAHYYHTFFEELFSFTLCCIQKVGGEEGKTQISKAPDYLKSGIVP